MVIDASEVLLLRTYEKALEILRSEGDTEEGYHAASALVAALQEVYPLLRYAPVAGLMPAASAALDGRRGESYEESEKLLEELILRTREQIARRQEYEAEVASRSPRPPRDQRRR